MGMFSVFSITLVPGFSQNTTFVEDKNGDRSRHLYLLGYYLLRFLASSHCDQSNQARSEEPDSGGDWHR